MSLDPIATMHDILDQIQANPTASVLNPSSTSTATVEIPALDWKADYYAALNAWKPVKEDRRHDHTPMPPPRLITSMQVGFIAKAPKAEPKRAPKTPPYKHKLCVEVWTVPHDHIVRNKRHTQWRRFAQLRPEAGFEKTLNGAVASRFVSQDFANWAMGLVRDRRPNTRLNDLYGLFHDSNGGWNYYDEHLVRIDMADPNKPVAYVYRNRELLTDLTMTTEHAGHTLPDGGTQTHEIRQDFGHDE